MRSTGRLPQFNRFQGALLVSALAVGTLTRIEAVARHYPADKDQRSDVRRYYLSMADSAIAGHGFIPSYATNFIPPPGQAFFLYTAKKLLPRADNQHLRTLQALVSIMTLALAGLLAFELCGPWASVFATWLLALEYRNADLVGVLLPETNYLFAVVGFAWCLLRALRQESARLALAAGLLLGVACLFKPTPSLFGLVAAAGAWRSVGPEARVRFAGLLLLGQLLVVGPWVARNYVHYGRIYPISTNGGTLLALSNYAGLDPARADMVYWDDLYRRPDWVDPALEARFKGTRDVDGKLEENLKDRGYLQDTERYVLAHPGQFLRNYAIKLGNFLRYPPAMPSRAPLPFREIALLTPLVTALALVGSVGLLVFRRSDPGAWALPALLLYLLAFGALLHLTRDGRMNQPFRALATVPAGCVIGSLLTFVVESRPGSLRRQAAAQPPAARASL